MDTVQEYEIDPVSYLEYASQPVRESMPKTIDWKGWLGLVMGAIVFVGGTTWKLASEFSKIDKHISRVEMAVRIIGAKQGGDTKTLIDEALTVAKNAADAGRTESAKNVLNIANRLLAEQKASLA